MCLEITRVSWLENVYFMCGIKHALLDTKISALVDNENALFLAPKTRAFERWSLINCFFPWEWSIATCNRMKLTAGWQQCFRLLLCLILFGVVCSFGDGSSHPCPPLDCLKRWQSDHTCRHPHRFNQLATRSEKWNGKRRLECVDGRHPPLKTPVGVLHWSCRSEGKWRSR